MSDAFALLVFLPPDYPSVQLELDSSTTSFVGEAEQLFKTERDQLQDENKIEVARSLGMAGGVAGGKRCALGR